MPREALAYLLDIAESAEAIADDTADLMLERYLVNRTVRRATERNFQIIGEALRRLRDVRPDLLQQIDHAAEIIAFRNIVVHAYFGLDHRRIWAIVQQDLPTLRRQIAHMINQERRA